MINLRNDSNIFPVDQGINQKRMENCVNAPSELLQKFSILFSVDTWINWKNIRLISYHFIFSLPLDIKNYHSKPFKCRVISNF